MRKLVTLLLLSLAVACLSGCGAIMSSAGAGPIEEDDGERTFAQQVADESIEKLDTETAVTLVYTF